MNPLRKAAALALVLPAATALIALTGAASATAENVTGDLDTEGPTTSSTDKAYEEPDMIDVAPADPFVCPDGHVHVFFNDVDACATVGPDGDPDPAGIVLDPSGGVLKPAGAIPAPETEETPEPPTAAATPAPSTPTSEPPTQEPSAAAEAPSSPTAQAPAASPASVPSSTAAEEAASDTGPVLVIAGGTVALLLAAAGAFVWERHSEGSDS